MVKFQIFACALVILLSSPVYATTYYIAKTGSDSHTTTQAQSPSTPWLTIGHGISQWSSGDTLIVNDNGTYSEHLTVTNSFGANSTITTAAGIGIICGGIVDGVPSNCISSAPIVQGFYLNGSNNISISGFNITNQNEGSGPEDETAYGIQINNSTNFTVSNNYVHELCSSGIEVLWHDTTSTGSINNNYVWRANMEGVGLSGAGVTAFDNVVWDTIQFPCRLGSTPPGTNPLGATNADMSGCIVRSGADADYYRFLGSNSTFNGNIGGGIQYQGSTANSDGTCPANPTVGMTCSANTSCYNPSPHIDGYQTFGSPTQTVSGNVIENGSITGTINAFNNEPDTACIGDMSSTYGTSTDVTVKGNFCINGIFGLSDDSVNPIVGPLKISNNTFAHMMDEAIIRFTTAAAGEFYQNNIFYDVGSGGDGPMYTNQSTFATNDHNIQYMRGGSSPGTYCGTPSPCPTYIISNPTFINYGDVNSLGGNFGLWSWSIAVNSANLTPGTGINIGASQGASTDRGAGLF